MLLLKFSSLTWIVLASILGGGLSVTCAALVALSARTSWVPMLISYAIGALLGAVFLEILPHAFREATNVESIAVTILLGILLFFILEKLVLWRHCHGDHCEVHAPNNETVTDNKSSEKYKVAERSDFPSIRIPGKKSALNDHDHGRSGLMIMIGDTFHNFVDGILIAAAFMSDIQLGLVTAIAIIAHEIPQEVGDFLILLHSGYSKRQAIVLNLLASLATLAGGLMAYFALRTLQNWIPNILGLAAASMIYVSVADLIPGLHKRTELSATVSQVILIGLGVLSIWFTRTMLGE